MATININANLNGGDDTTPDNELFYRIYGDVDNYASPIHTTGTAIADADVTVTGDVVDISNVDGTTNTSFKISAVDGAGNEGILSDAVSGTIIIFEDDFTGTTIDASKWLAVNPASQVVFSQNDELIATTSTPQSGYLADYQETIPQLSFADNPEMFIGYDFKTTATSPATSGFYANILLNESTDNGILMYLNTSMAKLQVSIKEGGTNVSSEEYTIDNVSIFNTIKCKVSETEVVVYRWTGSAWTTFVTQAITYSGYLKLRLFARSQASTTPVITYDNVYVTSEDYATQYPQ